MTLNSLTQKIHSSRHNFICPVAHPMRVQNEQNCSVNSPTIWQPRRLLTMSRRTDARGQAISPALSRAGAARELNYSISPELRESAAMWGAILFFGFVLLAGGICWVFVSAMLDWTGVCEGAARALKVSFRCFDLG